MALMIGRASTSCPIPAVLDLHFEMLQRISLCVQSPRPIVSASLPAPMLLRNGKGLTFRLSDVNKFKHNRLPRITGDARRRRLRIVNGQQK